MTENRSSAGAVSLLIALALLPFAIYSGLTPVGSSTEARELLVIDTILRDHEWLLPLRNGQVPSKPPLFHWLNALLSFPLGAASVWAARNLSTWLGAATVILTAMIAHAVGGGRSRLTFISAGLLLSTYGFVKLMGEARVDMLFAFLNTLAMWVVLRRFVPGFTAATGRLIPLDSSDLNLFFAICGLNVLARGPLGLILPVLTLGAILVQTAGVRRAAACLCRPRLGWLVASAIFLPWYGSAFFRGGDAFVSRQLIFENLRRFVGGEQVNTEVWWFYLPSFVRTAFPISVLFLFFHFRLRDKQAHLVALWFWVGLIFFSLASGKRHSYLLPLYPACAVFTALHLDRVLSRCSDRSTGYLRKLARALNPLTLLIAAVLLLEALRFFNDLGNPALFDAKSWFNQLLMRAELCTGVCGILIFAACLLPAIRLHYRDVALSWGMLLLIFNTTVILGDGFKNQLKAYPLQGAALAAAVPADQHLTVLKSEWDESFDVLLYYLKRPVTVRNPAAEPAPGLLLCSRSWIEGQREQLIQMGWQVREELSLRSSYDQILKRTDREKVLIELSGRS